MPNALAHVDWSFWLGGVMVLVASLAGIVITALTLPGTWLAVLAGLGLKLWQPGSMGWWVVIVAAALALLGEAIELGASALGAAKGGASRRGAIGAVVGSLAGAILGSPFLFPIGTIIGSVAGAGVGALIGERTHEHKNWSEVSRAATGAALGRLVATMAKTSLAAIIGIVLSIAAFVP